MHLRWLVVIVVWGITITSGWWGSIYQVQGARGGREIRRISVNRARGNPDGSSSDPAISADGQVVGFSSSGSNIVPDDTNGHADIFAYALADGQIARPTLPDGSDPNGGSFNPILSADGRYVLFQSYATNWVTGDDNQDTDVFVWDRVTGVVELISIATDGGVGNGRSDPVGISADGRWVAFRSSSTNIIAGQPVSFQPHMFFRDRQSGVSAAALVGIDGELLPVEGGTFSADARYLTFWTSSDKAVPNDTNGKQDVFVRDMWAGSTTRISQGVGGAESNGASNDAVLSADGRWVAYDSDATNLVADGVIHVGVFLYDRTTGTTIRVSQRVDGSPATHGDRPEISGDGGMITYISNDNTIVTGDGNQTLDVFRYDRVTQTVELLSATFNGGAGNLTSDDVALDGSGQRALFRSAAFNLIDGDTNGHNDIFIVVPGGTLPSPPPLPTSTFAPTVTVRSSPTTTATASISPTPRPTHSGADLFLPLMQRTLPHPRRQLLNITQSANGASWMPGASASGDVVVFTSEADNLVVGDTNGVSDVFIWRGTPHQFQRVSVAGDGSQGNAASYAGVISTNGRYVVFTSAASNLMPGDVNGLPDVLRYDVWSGEVAVVSIAEDGGNATGNSYGGAISADGNRVAFGSLAGNLAPPNGSTGTAVYVRDMGAGTTQSVGYSHDASDVSLSADGETLTFAQPFYNGRPGLFVVPPGTGVREPIALSGEYTFYDLLHLAPGGRGSYWYTAERPLRDLTADRVYGLYGCMIGSGGQEIL